VVTTQIKGLQGEAWNGDANGAYNIARKGIIISEKIKNFYENKGTVDKLQYKDISIARKEWG